MTPGAQRPQNLVVLGPMKMRWIFFMALLPVFCSELTLGSEPPSLAGGLM